MVSEVRKYHKTVLSLQTMVARPVAHLSQVVCLPSPKPVDLDLLVEEFDLCGHFHSASWAPDSSAVVLEYFVPFDAEGDYEVCDKGHRVSTMQLS